MESPTQNRKLFYGGLFIIPVVLHWWFTPEWLRIASKDELRNWFPHTGEGLYFFFNYFAPIYVLIFSAIAIFFILRYAYRFLGLYTAFGQFLKAYLVEDTYRNRRFVGNIFYKFLSFVYLNAFGAVLWQFEIVSENGLIPYKEFAFVTFQHEGIWAFFNYPSVFWVSQSNVFIFIILFSCFIISAIGIFMNRPKAIFSLWQWFCYLSIVSFGRDLFHLPWDPFLLEIGFISFIAAFFIEKYETLPRIVWLAFLILFFRQWLSMGMTKLVYSDPRWMDLTFMKEYWLNIPFPTPLSPYIFQLPMWVHKCITFLTLAVELLIPFAMIFGRKGRYAAFLMSLLLSLGIEFTGNFGFFNVLTATLGVWCLEDSFFGKGIVSNANFKPQEFSWQAISFLGITSVVVAFNLFYSSLQLFDEEAQKNDTSFLNYYFVKESRNPIYLLGIAATKLKLVSPHGVFKGLHNEGLHLKIQSKSEGAVEWETLKFKKGLDILDYSFVSPFQYRLPFHFYYQVYGHNWFDRLKRIYPYTAYLNPTMKNLLVGLFDRNEEIGKLITLPKTSKFKIKILREQIQCNSEGDIFVVPYDSLILESKSDISVPVFAKN
jgi:uncharacterized membrane protein YphA (DoxX/SURF4 family)